MDLNLEHHVIDAVSVGLMSAHPRSLHVTVDFALTASSTLGSMRESRCDCALEVSFSEVLAHQIRHPKFFLLGRAEPIFMNQTFHTPSPGPSAEQQSASHSFSGSVAVSTRRTERRARVTFFTHFLQLEGAFVARLPLGNSFTSLRAVDVKVLWGHPVMVVGRWELPPSPNEDASVAIGCDIDGFRSVVVTNGASSVTPTNAMIIICGAVPSVMGGEALLAAARRASGGAAGETSSSLLVSRDGILGRFRSLMWMFVPQWIREWSHTQIVAFVLLTVWTLWRVRHIGTSIEPVVDDD